MGLQVIDPQNLQKNMQPSQHLDFGLRRPRAEEAFEPTLTLDPQNCEITDPRCKRSCWCNSLGSNRKQIPHRENGANQPLPTPRGLTMEGGSPKSCAVPRRSGKGAWTRSTAVLNLKKHSLRSGPLELPASGSDPRSDNRVAGAVSASGTSPALPHPSLQFPASSMFPPLLRCPENSLEPSQLPASDRRRFPVNPQ